MNIEELLVKLGLDSSGLTKGMASARSDVKSIETQTGTSMTKAGKSMDEAGKHASALGGVFRGLGTAVSVMSGMLMTQGVDALISFGKAGYEEAQMEIKLNAQTQAVIKSTGAAAGVTADHVAQLRDSIALAAGIMPDVVQNGENLLLTFTNIRNEAGKGNDIFDQTTQIMTDLSVALGQDTKSSAIQLGKALNDPIQGVTALRRVGVSFSQDQLTLIKRLQNSGDLMGAQKVILAELNKEFAGSAAAQATPMQKVSVAVTEAAGKLMTRLMPAILAISQALPGVIDTISNFASALMDKAGPIIEQLTPLAGYLIESFSHLGNVIASALAPAFKALGDAAEPVFRFLQWLGFLIGDLISGDLATFTDDVYAATHQLQTLGPVGQALAGVLQGIGNAVSGAQQAFADIQPGLMWLTDNGSNLTPIIAGIGAVILVALVPSLYAAAAGFLATVVAAAPWIALAVAIAAGVALLVYAWQHDFGGIQEKVKAVVAAVLPVLQKLADGFTKAFNWIIKNVVPALTAAFNWFVKNVIPALGAAFDWIVKNVVPALSQALDWIVQNVIPPLSAAFDWFTKNVLPAVGTAIDWIVKNVLPPLNDAINWIVTNVLPPLAAAAKTVFDAIGTYVKVGVQVVTTEFNALKTAIGVVGTVFDALKTGVGVVWGGITSVIKGAINTIIGAINVFIGAIDSIKVPGFSIPNPLGGSIGFSGWNGFGIAQLPYLHSGGIVPGARGADVPIIAQAGELVLTPQQQAAMGLGGGMYNSGNTVNINNPRPEPASQSTYFWNLMMARRGYMPQGG